MKAYLLGLLLPFATVAAGAPAYADVYVTYSGTIWLGSDQTNIFGLGMDLTGASYTATFVFDPALGTVYSDPVSSYALGGQAVGTPASPAISAAITINGVTDSIGPGNWYGDIYAYNDGTSSNQYHEADYLNNDANGVFVYNYSDDSLSNAGTAIPGRITQSFSYVLNPSTDSSYGYFQFYSMELGAGSPFINTYGYVTPTMLTVYSTPEPSTWVMTLTGAAALMSFAYFKKSRSPQRSI